MLKKSTSLLLAALLILSLSACGTKEPTQSQRFDALTAETIPTLEETKAFSLADRAALRVAMEQLPLESCEKMLSKQVAEFCHAHGAAELVELHLGKDLLSMSDEGNRKPIENLLVEIKVNLHHSDDPDFQAVAASKEFFDSLNDYLRTLPYTGFLTKEITLRASYDGIDPVNTFQSSVSYADPIAFLEQPEEELAVQTIAYDFAEKHEGFQLEKFGAIPESGELYVEYYLPDDYLLRDTVQKNPEQVIEELYQDVLSRLLTEAVTEKYAQKNSLTSIRISFVNGCLEDGFLTFHENL